MSCACVNSFLVLFVVNSIIKSDDDGTCRGMLKCLVELYDYSFFKEKESCS